MNKSIFLFAALSAVLALSSCSKCTECTDCTVEQTICRDGYDSNDDYQQAIDEAEFIGCDCKATVK